MKINLILPRVNLRRDKAFCSGIDIVSKTQLQNVLEYHCFLGSFTTSTSQNQNYVDCTKAEMRVFYLINGSCSFPEEQEALTY